MRTARTAVAAVLLAAALVGGGAATAFAAPTRRSPRSGVSSFLPATSSARAPTSS